jgi:hypothetical protein
MNRPLWLSSTFHITKFGHDFSKLVYIGIFQATILKRETSKL